MSSFNSPLRCRSTQKVSAGSQNSKTGNETGRPRRHAALPGRPAGGLTASGILSAYSFGDRCGNQRVQAHAFAFCPFDQTSMQASGHALTPLAATRHGIRLRNTLAEDLIGSSKGRPNERILASKYFRRLHAPLLSRAPIRRGLDNLPHNWVR